MTSTGLISSLEALEVLGLYNPADGKNPQSQYLTYLHKRGLLQRYPVGHRSILYKKKDCLALFDRAMTEGISLKAKPE